MHVQTPPNQEVSIKVEVGMYLINKFLLGIEALVNVFIAELGVFNVFFIILAGGSLRLTLPTFEHWFCHILA